MLKSYKDIARWYPALEPPSVSEASPVSERPAFGDGAEAGVARYPHYIRDTEPEPFDAPFGDDSFRRSEFTGGWDDWVGDQAPGPDDDYPAVDGEVVQFPWDGRDDEHVAPPLGRPVTDLDASGRIDPDGPAAAAPRTLRARTRPDPWRIALVLAVAALVLVSAAAVALSILHFGGGAAHSGAPATGPVRLTSGIDEGAPVDFCPTERAARVIRGAEPGGTDSGPSAIMWFQHSYYVERSAARLHDVVAPGAAVPSAALIQRGIDSVPQGTAHCVRVTTVDTDSDGGGKYTVAVTERRPGGVPTTYGRQTVTTAVIGGRTLITGIAAG